MRRELGRCLLPDLLAQRGWLQKDLADRTGLTTTQISDFVTNRRTMSLATAKRIAGALRCRIEDLYENLDTFGDE